MEKHITINVPDGKSGKITEGDDGIRITWIDEVNQFKEYVQRYRNEKAPMVAPYLYPWSIIRLDPTQWHIQDKFGLLQMIADDLNGAWEANWVDQAQAKYAVSYDYSDNVIGPMMWYHVQIPTIVFSKEAVQKAVEIIPPEFIKSFN